jgi:undecaprenyl phosphate N,N'-diacetylbacillosamine 1-phosphate transferase
MYQKYVKRLFDIAISLCLIIFFSPIIIIIFLTVFFFIGYPIFKQKRPGLNNKIFILYKFKTLIDYPKNIPEEKRQTKLGNFLRKSGLDELPQLFNILENKMSLVGPRPLLVEYLKKYSNYEKKRHLVKPGITGLAQVNPTNSRKKYWDQSLKLDIFYAENVSFVLDLKILFKTILIVLENKKQYNDFKKSL